MMTDASRSDVVADESSSDDEASSAVKPEGYWTKLAREHIQNSISQ